MLSVVFSWLLCLSSASVYPASSIAASDTITVHGLCWDVTTGRNLKATISALVDGRKIKVGQSDADGLFKLWIADSTQILSFEVDGYPVTSLPINKTGAMDTSARFWFDLPMISKDSQQVIKAYQAARRPSDSPARSDRRNRNRYFQVQNAQTLKRIPATICFTYASSGRTQCVAIDSTKVPSFIQLDARQKITFDVRAEGYQTYHGEIPANLPDTADTFYQIKLLMLNNILSVSFALPPNLVLSEYEFRGTTNKTKLYWGPKKIPTHFRENSFKPGEVYRFVAKSTEGNVVADETFRMNPGLTLKAFHRILPKSAEMAPNGSETPAFFDSTVLYFDQSDYSLRKEARDKLDSISWQLIKLRHVKAQLTGHTDNVGQRNLNRLLSEYRTRVVSTYLHRKGVPANQLSSSWNGPDSPVAPNDTEVNKAKNRRVVIQFFTK
ncbi:OmpA family protein [Larkinella bovis]|uniref:OmpA family protein n=1 Tax=Larkinella bovis TaxID=683041 RepID=A0ABW0I804_9BACT